jgi:hypothetical protein
VCGLIFFCQRPNFSADLAEIIFQKLATLMLEPPPLEPELHEIPEHKLLEPHHNKALLQQNNAALAVQCWFILNTYDVSLAL